jgi:hypothetical protein
MKKTHYTTLLLGMMLSLEAHAQYVTFNHDDTKMNQITVAEIGSGSLTPSLYYDMVHQSYAKNAAARNKLSYRTAAGLAIYPQVEDAAKVDSALTKRAEVEALNIADRTGGALDIAWKSEGDKITEKMSDYETNIRRILYAGGTANEQTYWTEYYNVFQTAISATRNSYMPNSERMKQYLQIYADVTRKNDALINYIVLLTTQKRTQGLLAATYSKQDRRQQIALAALNRWREHGWEIVVNSSSGNTGSSGSTGSSGGSSSGTITNRPTIAPGGSFNNWGNLIDSLNNSNNNTNIGIKDPIIGNDNIIMK